MESIESYTITFEWGDLPPAVIPDRIHATPEEMAQVKNGFRCYICLRKFSARQLGMIIDEQRICETCAPEATGRWILWLERLDTGNTLGFGGPFHNYQRCGVCKRHHE